MPAAAAAQIPKDESTSFTFSQPVMIPGHTLPAGTYVFRIADTSDRHVIQVMDKGGSKVIATVFAIPSVRAEQPKNSEVRFLETPADVTPAIQSWWYIGVKSGHEFIYSKAEARRLAKGTTHGVLAQADNGGVSRVSAMGDEVTVTTDEPTPAPLPPSSLVGTTPPLMIEPAPMPPTLEPPQPDLSMSQPRTELPHTASARPVLLWVGLAALFVGLATSGIPRRPNA
jgi:hypothetical protein